MSQADEPNFVTMCGGTDRLGWISFKRRSAPAVMVVLQLSIGGLAQAQSVNVAQQRTPAPEDTPALQEIIVTAEKRPERLQDVPSSISVLGGAQLEKFEAESLIESAGYVPGMSVTSGGGPGQTQITLRGLATDSVGLGALVGTYIDDMPVSTSTAAIRGSLFALDLMPYDIDNIEVLRGPQGTLYGAGAMGGLVKYDLKSPSLTDFDARAGVTSNYIDGSHGAGWGVRGAVNLPIIPDQLAIRLSGFDQHTAGFIHNVGLGTDDDNHYTQTGGRGVVLWKPADDVSIKASVLYQDIDMTGTTYVQINRLTLQPTFGANTDSTDAQTGFNQNIRLYSLVADWNLHFATLTSASSWQRTGTLVTSDLTSTFQGFVNSVTGGAYPQNVEPFPLALSLDKFTQELRLTSAADQRLQWMVGGYYTDERALNAEPLVAYETDGGPEIPSSLNPVYHNFFPTNYREKALFANSTFKFNSEFDLTGGVRYSRNDQVTYESLYGSLVGTQVVPSPTVIQTDENSTTWMLSPQWHIDKDKMVYARIATGYRPGGYNGSLVAPYTDSSDTVKSYEVGYKSVLLEGRLSLDASVFDIDWKNVQVNVFDPATGLNHYANAAAARSKGGEISGAYTIVRNLTIGTTFAYTDARLTQDAPGIGGRVGDQLPLSSRLSGSVTLDYKHPLTGDLALSAGAGYRWSDGVWTTVSSGPEATFIKYGNPVDIFSGIEIDKFAFKVFARNLFNAGSRYTFVRDTTTPTALDLVPIQPLTVGVSMEARY